MRFGRHMWATYVTPVAGRVCLVNHRRCSTASAATSLQYRMPCNPFAMLWFHRRCRCTDCKPIWRLTTPCWRMASLRSQGANSAPSSVTKATRWRASNRCSSRRGQGVRRRRGRWRARRRAGRPWAACAHRRTAAATEHTVYRMEEAAGSDRSCVGTQVTVSGYVQHMGCLGAASPALGLAASWCLARAVQVGLGCCVPLLYLLLNALLSWAHRADVCACTS